MKKTKANSKVSIKTVKGSVNIGGVIVKKKNDRTFEKYQESINNSSQR
jgi:hypothetical protein